jgi:hypothetical protein
MLLIGNLTKVMEGGLIDQHLAVIAVVLLWMMISGQQNQVFLLVLAVMPTWK